MRRLHAAQMHEALQWLLFASTWHGGWMPVRLGEWPPAAVVWRSWTASREQSDLAGVVRWLDERHEDEVLLGIPQAKPFNGGVGSASMLWCRIEGKDQEQRARAFSPRPSMVLQEGSTTRRWLLWVLERPLPWSDLKAANRRLAYHLRAVQKHGDPDAVWIPAPGTCIRGRGRPVPVVVGRLTEATYDWREVVGRLREPPAADAWMADRGGSRA